MFFEPLVAQELVEALLLRRLAQAAVSAERLVRNETLRNSAIKSAVEYNEPSALAEVIQTKLVQMSTASVAMVYGTLVPEILGLALDFLEKQKETNGKASSEPEQQSNEEDPSGT
mgnify:CR=1 FL=1